MDTFGHEPNEASQHLPVTAELGSPFPILSSCYDLRQKGDVCDPDVFDGDYDDMPPDRCGIMFKQIGKRVSSMP